MDQDRKKTRKLIGIIVFAIVLFVGLWHLPAVLNVLGKLLRVVSFFFIGLGMAFILNALMRRIENRLFAPLNRRLGRRWKKMRRPAAVTLTLLSFFAVLLLVVFMVIPEMGRTITILADEIPGFVSNVNVWLGELSARYEAIPSTLNLESIDWANLGQSALDVLRNGAGTVVSGTFSAATSIASGVVSVVIGFILAIYVLLSKNRLSAQVRKLLYAYLPEKSADWLVHVGTQATTIFSNFLSGQFFEAVILGVLCFLGMSVFGFQFAPMVSVLVGVTAFIPIFGAFIGMTVGVFMILVNQSPMAALWFVLFFLVLQQIEGNLIYPNVVGKSVMLPGLWVLVAVTVGGNLAGILGMIISVPLCSLLFALLRDAAHKRNVRRGIAPEKIEAME